MRPMSGDANDEPAHGRGELVAAYLTHLRTQDESLFWAWEEVEVGLRDDPHEWWMTILALLDSADSGEEIGRIASGPLESLLSSRAGLAMIGTVDAIAPSAPRLRRALAACWLSSRAYVSPDS